jgi:Fibronectin type III domain
MKRKIAFLAASLLVLALSAGAVVAASGGNGATSGRVKPASAGKTALKYAESDLFIEINGTDGDAGLQLNLDGEKWDNLQIVNPRGQKILDVSSGGRLEGYGLTGLTFESAEPPFDEFPFSKFKARFPAGTYRFTGVTVTGKRLVGSDRLTHVIPAMPVIVSPVEDSVVPTDGLVVEWKPVTKPRGVRIVHYEVIVTQVKGERELDAIMPPNATRLTIPAEFLRPRSEYAVEVLAREASGNQIITEISFKTS